MSLTLEQFLHKHYTEPSSPISFAAPKKVYNYVKKAGYSPRLAYIKEFVQSYDAYSLNKTVRRTFPRARLIAKGVSDLYDSDLAVMTDYVDDNPNAPYFIVVIDVVSKKLAARTLASKKALGVKNALQDIFEKDLPPCKVLRTDFGGEFVNKTVDNYLKKMDIYHQITLNTSIKAHVAERVLRTMKSQLGRLMVHNNNMRYEHLLPQVVASYNNSVHRSIQMRPNDVTKENEAVVWWRLYKPKSIRKVKPYQYRVGDSVRINYLKSTFERVNWRRWSTELFKVSHRYRRQGLANYHLVDYLGDPIKGNFYTAELQGVYAPPDKEFKIDKVISTRTRKGRKSYFVSWQGWPSKFNSWVTDIKNL